MLVNQLPPRRRCETRVHAKTRNTRSTTLSYLFRIDSSTNTSAGEFCTRPSITAVICNVFFVCRARSSFSLTVALRRFIISLIIHTRRPLHSGKLCCPRARCVLGGKPDWRCVCARARVVDACARTRICESAVYLFKYTGAVVGGGFGGDDATRGNIIPVWWRANATRRHACNASRLATQS